MTNPCQAIAGLPKTSQDFPLPAHSARTSKGDAGADKAEIARQTRTIPHSRRHQKAPARSVGKMGEGRRTRGRVVSAAAFDAA
jgi:hypothetical protein